MTLDRLGSADILQCTAGVLEVQLSLDGVATDPDPSPAPLVTVTDSGGAVVPAPAFAISVGSGSGRLRAILTPDLTARLRDLTTAWTFALGGVLQAVTTYHRIVADVLFTLGEARAWDGGALSDTGRYPDAAILAGRDRIAEAFEQICGAAFGVRAGRELFDGNGSESIQLSNQRVVGVRSLSIRSGTDWTVFSAEELSDLVVYPTGRVWRVWLGSFPAGRRNIAVEYEHGIQPVPAEIRQAALRLLRAQLVSSNLDDRATSQTDELGTFSLATAGKNGSYFGLPLVDEVLHRYSERLPVVA